MQFKLVPELTGMLLDTCGPLDASQAVKLEYIFQVNSGHQMSPELREEIEAHPAIQEHPKN